MRKTIVTALLGLSLLSSPIKSLSQTVSGYITDLFNNQPVPQALVTVDGLGSGTTNDQGYYAIGDTTNVVEFPYVITPRKTSKINVFNIIGQKVISLDNIIEGSNINLNNFSKGIYILRHFDNKGEIIGHNRISNINGEHPVVLSVPDRIVENNKSGRKINSPMDSYEVRVNHPDFLERIDYVNEGETTYNESLIDCDSLELEHRKEVLIMSEYWASVRWPDDVDPIFKIWPYFIQNSQPVSQGEIDNIESAVDSVSFYSDELFYGNITGQREIVDVLPPAQTPGIIRVYYDSSIPFPSGVSISYNNQTHEVYYASIRFKFEGLSFNKFLAEVIRTVTVALDESNVIMPSIFNESPLIDYLTDEDKKIIESNNLREIPWLSPDTNYPN